MKKPKAPCDTVIGEHCIYYFKSPLSSAKSHCHCPVQGRIVTVMYMIALSLSCAGSHCPVQGRIVIVMYIIALSLSNTNVSESLENIEECLLDTGSN